MSQPMPPAAPPPPPQYPPPAAPDAGNRTLMIVFSYIPFLNFIPLIVEQNDPEVKWHAKHGLVLFIFDLIVMGVLGAGSMIPIIGCVVWIFAAIASIGLLVLHVACIIKGINGQRFVIPVLSDFVNKF
jgi:uncharacterized membrane protein